jgi:predicted dinucleotide-binding enzyme
VSSISIIGTGQMARMLGGLAVEGGNAVEVIGRVPAKAAGLAGALGRGATAGTMGTAPAGDIVILAVLYSSAAPVVSQYGDALAGKVIVDISNPFNPRRHRAGHPGRYLHRAAVARAAPASAHVIKAFNTIFGTVLARGGPLDVFLAGDDAQAKASMAAFIQSMGLRPLDTGDLTMAHWLEGAALMMMGLGRYGVGNYGFSLAATIPG